VNVIDSSAWLAYFANEPNASHFAPAIENISQLLVPSITLYEVFKRVLQQQGEQLALQAVAAMMQGKVIDLDSEIALNAALVSANLKIPMADSIILATAQKYGATLWTQDIDLQGLPNVQFFPTSSTESIGGQV